MILPDSAAAMMADIEMEYDAALQDARIAQDGSKSWRNVVYAVEMGFCPLMLEMDVPKGEGPFPLVVFIHGGAWFIGHPTITNPMSPMRLCRVARVLVRARSVVIRAFSRINDRTSTFPHASGSSAHARW